MFHIGIAVQHPPLPDPSQLSELGIDFIRQCLTIDADARPTAFDLMNHPWIVELEERVNLAFEDEMGPATNSSGSSGSMNTSSGGSTTTSSGGSMNTWGDQTSGVNLLSNGISGVVLEEDEDEDGEGERG
jgi:mitogen-activated protein kinase kinase kinase